MKQQLMLMVRSRRGAVLAVLWLQRVQGQRRQEWTRCRRYGRCCCCRLAGVQRHADSRRKRWRLTHLLLLLPLCGRRRVIVISGL